MAKFCGKCGQRVDAKTGLCPQCDQAILMKKKKRNKFVRVVITVLCCISIIIAGIYGALKFFVKDTVSYTYDEYNSFMEGFTDVLVTDEKSAIKAVSSISDILGIKDAEKELKVVSVNSVSTDKYYRMQQYYKDIPVYGRTVVLSADKGNNATALTSNFITITDDVSLKPTVAQKDLNKSVQKYFDKDDVTFFVDDSNLVLYQTENGDMALCYEITVFSKRIVLDANTAEILVATNLYVQDMVECKYKDGSFQGIKISENNYQIGNEEKGIFVFNANYNPVIKTEENDGKTTFVSVPENSLPMTSTDNYFGNNDSFAPEEYAKAVYMLNTLQSISNYYEKLNAEQNTSVIVTMNDSFDPDNAFGGYGDIKSATTATIPYKKDGIISIFFGQDLCNDIYGHLDTLGHEYMHGINHSYFKSDKDESSAIDEAYADIFGELSEAMIKNQSPNWIHGQRNMINPHEYDNAKHPYPASIIELEKAKTFKGDDGALWYYTTANSGTDFSHFASTIISHCAYLMWNGIDGTSERKIQQPELGELWYRSLLFLQDNTDFEQCRNSVELAARSMMKNNEITDEQYKTVVTAFERVGIENATFTYTETVKNKFDLSVLSSEETENVHFKLEVIKMPTIKAGPGIVNNEMPKLVMEKTAITGRQSLDLKNGTYVLRITDVSDERNISQSINIKIVVNGNSDNAKDEVIVNTDFTDVIVAILNEKPSENEDEQNTVPSNAVLSPESAVDIYMAYKSIWMENPEYMPMQGYGYCLLDLDFDGVLELINSVNDGSGRYSYNKYYKINLETYIVEEMNVSSEDDEGGFDYYYLGTDQTKLLRNKLDNTMFYYCSDFLRVTTGEYTTSYGKAYIDNGKVQQFPVFCEYMCEAGLYDNDEEIKEYSYYGSDDYIPISEIQYNQKVADFFETNTDLNLLWKCISGNEFDKGADSIQKLLLLDAYCSYSYDGFSFNNIETYDITLKQPELTQQNVENSDERDIVIVQDTSGSMSGIPIEEVKKASTKFISTILNEDASIGIVTYASSAEMRSDFSINGSQLQDIVSDISAGGGTNIESGLQEAEEMLENSNAKKKIIVLMSDGEPGSGKVGDELIAYADNIKAKGVYIYTLGFFESMESGKSSAQILMEEMASEGCHYEVANAEDLVFFFGDIADQINGQKYIYVRIACPVDVTVTHNGETLCSAEDELCTRTNFGSITFEENTEEAVESKDNRIKILRLKEGTDYDIRIEGNGRGHMDYTIGFMDENGEYSDLRQFENIKISKRTIVETVATNSDATILNVDEDGDGKYDLKYKAKENSRGEVVDYTYLVYVIIIVVLLLLVVIMIVKIKKTKNVRRTI